ncbi:hypothetical protein Hanom_Chr16g01426221 [Helianthus anomalus]
MMVVVPNRNEPPNRGRKRVRRGRFRGVRLGFARKFYLHRRRSGDAAVLRPELRWSDLCERERVWRVLAA